MAQIEDLSAYSETLIPIATEYGLSIIGAILILILGYFVANWAAKKVRKTSSMTDAIDDTLVPILAQTTRIFILIVTVLAVLGQFGVETTSIVAILGAAGLAVGLALQGTLSNIAAGIMLLVLRPFKIGDVVNIGGTLGVVDEIGLFVTELHSFDNIGITMPNSKVWGNEIQNITKFETRRVDMEFGIAYDDNMDKAITLIKEVLDKEDRILKEPEPLIAISKLGDSSVNILVRPWTKTSDVWPVRFDMIKAVKEKFDANGISFPFPQRDVHLFQQKN